MEGPHEPENAVEKEIVSEEQSPFEIAKHLRWCGRFELGKWYCGCEYTAKPLVVGIKGFNPGKKFYGCRRAEKDRCNFRVWSDEEAEAKDWLRDHPQTPQKLDTKPGEPETPIKGPSKLQATLKKWLSTSGKKRAIEEISDEGDEAGVEIQNKDDSDTFDQDNTRNGSPSRKSAKNGRFDTPGQALNKNLEPFKTLLPTPSTSGRDMEEVLEARRLQSMDARGASPTPVQLDGVIDLVGEDEPVSEKSDLFATVIGLIQADHPDLKASTKIMIRHEIQQEARRNHAEAKGYRKTIARLRNKVDDLETALSGLLPDDNSIELSD